MAVPRKDEVLQPIGSDTQAVPRYNLVDAAGNVVASNVALILQNTIVTPGTPVDAQVLNECLAASGVTAGTETAYTLAQDNFHLVDGALVRIRLHVNSGATPTLNVNNTGAKALMSSATKPFKAGIPAGTWCTFIYSASLGFFLQQGSGEEKGSRFGNGPGQISSFELMMMAGGDPTNYVRPFN